MNESTPDRAFVREAGSGPTLLCLHSNASSSTQWRALMELLSPRFRVLAPDQLGAGRSPPWPAARRDGAGRLDDEVALLAPVLASAGPRFHLLGHSYGGALALHLALAMPERVASLALYEPTMFGLLEQAQPGGVAAAAIARTAEAAAQAAARGDLDAAGRHFIDYWMGAGSWLLMPAERRATVADAMRPIATWAAALFAEAATLQDLARLHMPVLLLGGATSPASAQEVLRLLRQAWPQAQSVLLPGLGHMGPVTHAAQVNREVERFLLAQTA
ncbi:MAG: alpha/beta hydrolase [Rubrivivax sp.]|nr:alpha/beta hydrolase [Rubrivivax sp.]MDP3615735.1 alpha/beta hydrolase [Rubrivivax sp.]